LDGQESELNQLKGKVRQITNKISNSIDEVKGQYGEFVQNVEEEVGSLAELISQVKVRSQPSNA